MSQGLASCSTESVLHLLVAFWLRVFRIEGDHRLRSAGCRDWCFSLGLMLNATNMAPEPRTHGETLWRLMDVWLRMRGWADSIDRNQRGFGE